LSRRAISINLPGKSIEIARRDNRLRINYALTSWPDGATLVAFEQNAALTDDGRILILDGPFEGITGDFYVGESNKAAWVRLGGRVHPAEAAPADAT